MKLRLNLSVVLAVLVAAFLAANGTAQADFGLNSVTVRAENQDGSVNTSAGSHPWAVTTQFKVNYTQGPDSVSPDGELKDLNVNLPVGFAGDPTAVPKCPLSDFLASVESGISSCSLDTVVGWIKVSASQSLPRLSVPNLDFVIKRPVYNLAPPPGIPAQIGFVAFNLARVRIDLSVRPDKPYEVQASLANSTQVVSLFGARLQVWGNPASPAHDFERGICVFSEEEACPSEAPEQPFLTMPRSCEGPRHATYAALSWEEPKATPVTGEAENAFEMTGCEGLDFDPTIASEPTAPSAGTSTGLDFSLDLSNPGLTEVEGTAGSDLKKAVVTLPLGVTTNPAVAAGLEGCTKAQFQSESLQPSPGSGCPEASKVGSVEVETPLLDETLHGSLYVAKQHDNEFDNLLTVNMVIRDQRQGILIRSAGRVEPDPVTGQLTTTFDDLPQLPFSHFRLHFRDGDRAPLISPPTCGRFVTRALLYPYARPGSPVVREAPFEISSGAGGGACVAESSQLPHAPGFSAGTLSPKAGVFSPFVFRVSRSDGSQRLSALTATLPEGLLGKLAGIPYCSEAQIAQAASRGGEGEGAVELASPSCPASSEIGSVVVGVGAGPSPLYVNGRAFLAGPYKGAPLSLEIITPAIAGPFDLGVVAVRTALHVDRRTAQITAVSDPIPPILHGLPLDLRSVALDLSKPNFTLNPTSCEPKSITGSVSSLLGSVSPLSQYFQASGCGALKFAPKLALSLSGKTRRAGHPALRAVLTYPKHVSSSNIARARVGLPKASFLDQGNIKQVCTQPQLKSQTCPKKSIYGRAKAWSPLLDKPLEGPVYLGVGFGHRIPDLVADLDGQIRVLLNGKIDTTPQGGIRNTFELVPDAPVSKFVLELRGGPKKGLIENSENLCLKPQRATVTFTAQNNKMAQFRSLIGNDCGKGKHQGGSR